MHKRKHLRTIIVQINYTIGYKKTNNLGNTH